MRLNFISSIPCNVSVDYRVGATNYTANVKRTLFVEGLTAEEEIFIFKAVTLSATCDGGENLSLQQENVNLGKGDDMKGYSVYITQNKAHDALDMFRTVTEEQIEKSVSGDPFIA